MSSGSFVTVLEFSWAVSEGDSSIDLLTLLNIFDTLKQYYDCK